MSKLTNLVALIVAAAVILAEQVTELRTIIFDDGVIDREEADALFEINDAVSGNENNDPGWQQLFVDGLVEYAVEREDNDEPDDIITQEASDYLATKIEGDGVVDDNEKALLRAISEATDGAESAEFRSLVNRVYDEDHPDLQEDGDMAEFMAMMAAMYDAEDEA
jgi:hypothetical protein